MDKGNCKEGKTSRPITKRSGKLSYKKSDENV